MDLVQGSGEGNVGGSASAAGYFEAHDSAIPAAKAHGAMINLLKALVILVLLGAIGGGAFGAYYVLVKRPRLRDEAERGRRRRPSRRVSLRRTPPRLTSRNCRPFGEKVTAPRFAGQSKRLWCVTPTVPITTRLRICWEA